MKNYKKYYVIPADPADVYNAITNKKMLEIWTGVEAIMEPVPDTEFSFWNGSITGLNLDFEENRKIVQQWYFGDQEPPSIVTIILHPDKKGTSAELKHTNIPDDAYDNITEGWDEDFFTALRELFI